MTSQFELEAIHFLQQANMPVDKRDVALLSTDIQLVADDQDGSQELDAYQAAMELKRRIGGYSNTKSYMACLRVPKRK